MNTTFVVLGYILIILAVLILISAFLKEDGKFKSFSDMLALIAFAVIVCGLGLFMTNYQNTIDTIQAKNQQAISAKYHKEMKSIKHFESTQKKELDK